MHRRAIRAIVLLLGLIGCLSASVQAQTVSQINVALAANGGVVTASSSIASHLPGSLNDGDRTGRNWSSSANNGGWNDNTINTYPDWVQVDFASSKTIHEIDVITLQDNFPSAVEPTSSMTFSLYGVTAFDVQYWDGGSWVTVSGGSVTGNNLVWRSFSFSDVTTSKIRVLVNNALQGYSRLVEVEAYQSDVVPTVSLSSPMNSAVFETSNVINVSASASDSDGTISKVEFFQGSTKLAERAASPYSFVWANAAAGTYSLTAKATDNLGVSITSSPVSITVSAPNGVISGKVTQADGTTPITPAGVNVLQGSAVIATATTNGTGNYSVSGLGAGTYTVEAAAAGYETARQSAVLTTGAAATVNFSLAIPISYVYDDLGRLTAVIDKDGNAASYVYDAVGNLLSISRQSATQANLIQFSPTSGPVGTPVTIYGTGFSTTAGLNTVTFNGTAASVISATSTQIVASVPTGATTGPIAVTSPTGSATSGTSFTLIGSPTISGFTPTVGASGTSVTISGTNFATTITQDRPTFNLADTWASSATSTSVVTSVPARGTSGHISLTAPNGTAVSSGDFFVPPAPMTAADVSATGRIAFGGTQTLNLTSSGQIGMMLFDATAGQQAGLQLSGLNSILGFSFTIYNPSGTTLLTVPHVGGSAFFDLTALPETGTYTAVVVYGSNTGNLTFTLYDDTIVNKPILPGGSPVTLAVAVPGQHPMATFYGQAGQRVSALLSGVTLPRPYSFAILKPDGITLFSMSNISPVAQTFIEPVTLSSTGKYTLLIDALDADLGNVALNLYDVPSDFSSSIVPGGDLMRVPIVAPGENAQLTFSGTTGQRISLNIYAVTIGNSDVYVYKPDGSVLVNLAGAVNRVGTSGAFVDTITLPATGTYTISINPYVDFTGYMSLALYNVPADVSGSLTTGGASVTATTTVPGQNIALTLSGTQNQQVSIHFRNNSISRVFYYLLKPDGTTLTSWSSTSASFDLSTTTLPVTGTYTVLVDPYLDATGSITVSATSP